MKTRLWLALAVCSMFASAAQAKTEFGQSNGAAFRIDVPDNWNHGLVIYYHGYASENHGARFDETKPLDPRLAVITKAGYAVIQSGYSQGGWAVEQAIPETEALRRYFVDKYAKPRDTFVAGESMGGLLTVMTLEQSPEPYAGGLDLCGAAVDTPSLFTRAFDFRVVFDYYFPGLLPDPAKVPAGYEASEELGKKVVAALHSKPEAAAAVLRFAQLQSKKDLIDGLLFGTWVLKDIERRAGGNPFDNRNTIYIGTSTDNALNDGVKRYAADPAALAYLQRYYTPTGRLTRPVLAIHTTYDPLVSPSVPGNYSLLARTVGAGDLFVVQYVKHEGHCNITPEEIERGFGELRRWKEKGVKPVPGALP
jgi:pimeloyl-ACP methyl ester carboxylesterase